MRNVRRDFSQGIFKVASKAPYWPEGVGEACGWPFIPPGCNWLSLLPLLEGFKVAKKFLAFPVPVGFPNLFGLFLAAFSTSYF